MRVASGDVNRREVERDLRGRWGDGGMGSESGSNASEQRGNQESRSTTESGQSMGLDTLVRLLVLGFTRGFY